MSSLVYISSVKYVVNNNNNNNNLVLAELRPDNIKATGVTGGGFS